MIPLSVAILPQVWLAIGLLPHGPIAAAGAVHKMVRLWYVKVDCTCGGGIRRHPVAAQILIQAELDAASVRYGHHQWHCGMQPRGGAYTYTTRPLQHCRQRLGRQRRGTCSSSHSKKMPGAHSTRSISLLSLQDLPLPP